MNPLPLVLVVDDLAANRDTLRELLGEANYEIVEASDGALALALATANPPDLVLLDVLMPDMDGFEVCRRLRAGPSLSAVPIIMVTALDNRASRLAGIEAGADDFVSKPFDRVELCARVRTITRLNRYRRLAEQRRQFQWVVEHAHDGYLLVNADDVILFANARARRWLGLPSEHMAMAPETFLHASRRTFLGQPAESWHGWPAIAPLERALPRLLVRPETAHAHAQVLEVTMHENSGTRLLRLCDVADRIAARRDQRSFQAMVRHKLRTPMNSILGPLELLALAGTHGDPRENAALAALALQGAERLNTAVVAVLRYAEASQPAAPGATFSAAGLAAVVAHVAEGLGLATVCVRVGEQTSRRSFPCSRGTLEWMLVELLENARKFHPRQAPAVEIVADSAPGAWIALAVNDDGLTLSSEQLAAMGRPFFQGEKNFTGEMPGMGLGLASVFALVWQTGGACLVRNRPNGPGLCVELRWPQPPAGGISPAADSPPPPRAAAVSP